MKALYHPGGTMARRAIQILEHVDRIGVLRPVGDVHRVRAGSALLTPAATWR